MTKSLFLVFLSLLLVSFCLAVHDLDTRYKFRRSLHSRYTLYWNYNPTLRNISFAVRVQTTGWVGFGISPNGDMTGSDVVIGWVQNGRTYFNDRFASARATPAIDEQQDWMLVDSEEENGFTTLEFTRNYTSCDPNDQDRNITDGTSRVVWSFNDADPVNGVLLRHDIRGSTSINLLGGLRNASADPPGTQSFSLRVNQITIPSTDTTYWCEGFELPQAVQDDEKYIIRYSPIVTEGNTAHVHHMLVYLCDQLNTTEPGGVCSGVSDGLSSCLSGTLLAAWAVGGQDFVFPSNIAFGIGGNEYRYALIQMHYDNPDMLSGVVDSSGMTFYYIDTPRQYNAGILEVGHTVLSLMVIPPKSTNYTIYGFCSSECTMHFPADGIRVFANTLHTHLIGVSAKLYHLRRDQQMCSTGNGLQELKPIDSNPNYDFNFQEAVHVEEVLVRPGDVLLLTCTYDSSRLSNVTLGGESTHEEMCLSFLNYYPRFDNISQCLSYSLPQSFTPFVTNYVTANELPAFQRLLGGSYSGRDISNAFNKLDWTTQQLNGLETTLRNGQQFAYCFGPAIDDRLTNYTRQNVPPIDCPYNAPPGNLECPDSVSPPSGGYTAYGLTVFALLVIVMMTLII